MTAGSRGDPRPRQPTTTGRDSTMTAKPTPDHPGTTEARDA
ncbi:hypothetical protein SEA_VAISHALI24_61 [Mycobacterium phage Vaishali24]|uniref:Uncharacterized protein n=2 Tax=Pegunavirus manad TaxID=1982929 RepID=A0A649VXL7_9CAUD|nr:hypothetical protein SEA_ROBYN_62 [Mycobacterium phage Robyn]QGJ96951.1 hypothetical protein SEA_VAISHALI24_61 [Mycobacterium phage Vaishali24]